MTDKTLTAGPNRQISLTFSLALTSGEIIDQIDTPAAFVWGDETLLPAFQKALKGCKAGDKRSVFIEASKGFGDSSEDNIQYFKPEQLTDAGIEPMVGMMINFNDDHRINKHEADVSGVVKSVDDDWVVIDFNHPLAGQDLLFGFEIHAVTLAPMELGISTRDVTDETPT